MKIVARSIKVVLLIVILAIVALLAFVATFDANNYKPQIIEQVEKATGRDFSIDGDINLSIFPWVGIKIEDVALGNEQGFKARQFAAIKQLDVKVNVLPLLKKQVEISTIRLHGLDVSLEVAKNKSNNWSGLSQPAQAEDVQTEKTIQEKSQQQQTPPVTEPESASALQSLKVEGFEFVDAVIRYDDRSTNTHATVSELNLKTGAITFDKLIDVTFGARIKNNQPEIDTRLTLATQLSFNREFSEFNLKNFVFTITADANEFLPQPETIEIKSDIRVLLDEQRVSLKQLQLSALGLITKADIRITQFLETPVIQGSIEVQPFNAREAAKRVGVVLPEMAKADALNHLALKTNIKLAGEKLQANNFVFTLDSSTLSGWLHINNISKQQLRYDLTFDQLNINHYMPPVAEVEAANVKVATVQPDNTVAAAQDATTADEKIELPLEMMRSLDIQGDFRIAALTAKEYDIKQFLMSLTAKTGVINIKPLSLQLLQGQINAAIQLDVKKDIPLYAIDLKVNQVQVGPVANPFLVGIMGDEPLEMDGAFNMSMDVKTRGETVQQLKRSSKGNIAFNMKQTRVKGFDPEYYMRSSIADYVASMGLGKSKTIMGNYRPRQVTVFELIRSNVKLADGKASTNNFLMDSKRVQVTAEGHVDIMQNSLDVLSSIRLPRGKTTVEKIFDQPMFVRVYGPFEALQYKIDTDRLKKSTTDVLKNEAKAKLNAEKQRLQKKAKAEEQRLRDKAKAEEQRLRDKAKAEEDRLKAKAKEEQKRTEKKLKDKLKDKFKGLF